ncbi:alpha/beta fold hydrolase [Stackebrandtia nassauensis]|uniref:Alpha/beta hydrolase fold protein n=1 Tax=Stackebrandtia nassauensis (strain DSM 44728 / CIP 108903 / NRRL B-16338 / NBRC 102104 / LLR-40K-21) TaxID=446470 RepID=D3Q7S1_STANL|nr:alpha/beta hydrolase [Stackebrandtia nassauensis]ADD44413.1 alpha/beta hydrolase fold protein [Stackebrandtia nassauensis DSM 44728]
MVKEFDVTLADGRTLHGYDTGGEDRMPVVWHHGTPNVGAPPAPLFVESERLGIRWVSYDRPGYGTSTPRPGRDFASAAGDVAAIADALGIDRFAVMGHSSGGPHALACAALLPERVTGVVAASALAPFDAEGLDWFAGMADGAAASLRASAAGRAAKEKYEETAEFDEAMFIPADYEALNGQWSWFNEVVRAAAANGPSPLIDDDLANVGDWGFDPRDVTVSTLVMHGAKDRLIPSSHGVWLVEHLPNARLRLLPGDGHISVMNSATEGLEFLAALGR